MPIFTWPSRPLTGSVRRPMPPTSSDHLGRSRPSATGNFLHSAAVRQAINRSVRPNRPEPARRGLGRTAAAPARRPNRRGPPRSCRPSSLLDWKAIRLDWSSCVRRCKRRAVGRRPRKRVAKKSSGQAFGSASKEKGGGPPLGSIRPSEATAVTNAVAANPNSRSTEISVGEFCINRWS